MSGYDSSAVRLLSAKVPAVHLDRMRELAESHDRTLSAEVRVALRGHIERSRAAFSGNLRLVDDDPGGAA